ncbi:MAG: O-antigen ligase family protein [Candidatus Omnitrophica bacterium]|nr:O-antigen ligase family protein [Candidatus Omnitrophota bacterium]
MLVWLKAIEWGFYLTLAVPLLLFGGGFVGGYTLLEGFTLVVGASLLIYSAIIQNPHGHPRFSFILFLPFLWAVYLGVQVFPLPPEWIQVLSPNRLILLRSFAPVEAARSVSMSLSTYSMWVEMGKYFSYVAVFFIAYYLLLDKAHLRRFCWVIIFLGLAIAILGLLFDQISPGKVYGLWTFDLSDPRTPYVNKNHFANYLLMTLSITLAFLILRLDRYQLFVNRSLREKLLWFGSREGTLWIVLLGSFAIQLGAFFHATSRGALLGFVAAIMSFGLLAFVRSRHWKLGLGLCVLVILILYLGIAQTQLLAAKWNALYDFIRRDLIANFKLSQELGFLSELGTKDFALFSRLTNWKDTFRIFLDYPLFGVGAGGFHEIFPFYRSLPEEGSLLQHTFYYAENELLQGLAELGLIGVGLLVAFGLMLAVRFLRWFSSSLKSKTLQWLSLGFLSGVLGMLTHSLVDFSMHLPANAALLAAFGGVLTRLSYAQELPENAPQGKQRVGWSLVRHLILKVPLAFGALFFLVPILWTQWHTEFQYRKGREELNRMVHEGIVSPVSVRLSYDSFLKGIQKGRHQDRFHAGLGEVYLYMGLLAQDRVEVQRAWFEKAEQSLKQAIALSPLNAQYHHLLGKLYESWNRNQEAENSFHRATHLDSQKPAYHFSLGKNQVRLAKKTSALESFQTAIAINPSYVEPTLDALVVSKLELQPEDFVRLVPKNRHQKQAGDRIVFYFEQRGDQATAEVLRGLL